MSLLEPGQVLRNILLEELDLQPAQILFTNQKFFIPVSGLFIAISYVGPAKVITRNSELVADTFGGQLEVQSATLLYMMQIDIMAYNDPKGGNQARARFAEIPMAIASIFSEQQQELYAMQIARHTTSILDTSFLEETEMVTRYTMTLMATSAIQKQASTNEYYDDFTKAVPPLLTVNV